MKLLLKSLALKNFKGIKEFNLMFNNTETKLYGANGTGKTTVADGFFFTMSGNDSKGKQAKEWIQTLDGNNEKVHKLDHEATEIIEVNGDSITLSRKVAEKWTKPRGQKDEVLAETLDYDYFIDGVSTPAKQFEKFLLENVFCGKFTADEFILMCNPTAFSELDWKKQRDILYKVCGNTSDDEVIATDDRFNFLTEALKHKDVETYKAALRKSIKDTKKEIDDLEAVIKDRKNSLIQEYNRQEVEKDKAEKEQYIITLNEQNKASDEQFQLIRCKQQELLNMEHALESKRKQWFEKNMKAVEEAKQEISKLETSIFNKSFDKDRLAKEIETFRQEVALISDIGGKVGPQLQDFRNRWVATCDMCMPEDSEICPHCGQTLPKEKLKEVKESFDSKKAAELDKLEREGKKMHSDRDAYNQRIAEDEKKLDELAAELEQLNVKKNELNQSITKVDNVKPFDGSAHEAKINELKAEIEQFKDQDNNDIKEKIETAQKDLQLIAVKLNKCDEYDKSLKTIGEKEADMKEKQLTLADLETQLMNTEDFATTKVKMLETKVNSYFEKVKFKLFKQNMKGNWEETCTALAVGANGALVDLKSGLANTALRVQAGIEICKALQKHFSYSCPIIVDNRESVTELPSVDGQVISLIVSENDKELRVE